MDLSDETLMTQVKAGQLTHAGLLFERYQQRVYHYFLRSLGNGADAQDAAQATFTRMLHYRHSYQAGKKFSTWLFSIAFNQRNLQLSKQAQRAEESLEPSHAPLDLICPTDHVGRAQLQQHVEQGLARLKPEQRDLLSLFLWEERSYAELAEIHQTKVATLRVRIHRALQALRQCMQETGATP